MQQINEKSITVLSLFLILIMFTTFNPNNLDFGFIFKIKKIEIKNQILEKNMKIGLKNYLVPAYLF